MCGRYALPIEPSDLPFEFGRFNLDVDQVLNSESRSNNQYNIGPMATEPVYLFTIPDQEQQLQRVVQYMKWGMIPFWAKSSEGTSNKLSTFNARLENLQQNKIWLPNLNNRCAVPISGYYEWQSGTKKTPYYITRKDGRLMYLAGLYSLTTIDGKEVYSYTIITAEAPEKLKWLHPRMPVVLNPQRNDFETWLSKTKDKKSDWAELKSCLKIYDDDYLEWYKTDPEVGKIKLDKPEFIKPLKEPKSILHMFPSSSKKNAIEVKTETDGTKEIKTEDADNLEVKKTQNINENTSINMKEEEQDIPSLQAEQTSPYKSRKVDNKNGVTSATLTSTSPYKSRKQKSPSNKRTLDDLFASAKRQKK